MPTQYIKTFGALTINDGDPSKPIDIRTGEDVATRGAITINGQAVGGGGGGGGDVFKAGNNNQAGQLQTFTCPITVAPTFDLTANGDFKANANIIASSASTVQVLGQLDLADAPNQVAAVISDGGVFEMRAQKGAGQGDLNADFSPNTGVYRFGVDAQSGAREATVEVRGQLEIENAGDTVIRLNGQGAGANAGLLQATSFQAQGGTYRGTTALGADYVNLGIQGLDTTGATAGNSFVLRDGAIGARTTRHSLTYFAGGNEILENIPATGNQKVITTDTNVPAPGTGLYKLQTQTQEDTIFHMPPINQVLNNYQMTAFTLPDVTMSVTDALNVAVIFSLGTGQTVATSVTTDTSLIPVVPVPGGGTYLGGLSLPFGRYRLILRQKAGPNPARDMEATGTISGLTVSEEILYTGFPPVNASSEFINVFHTHNADYDFSSWSGSALQGGTPTFPPKANTDGRIQVTHQSIAGGHTYYLAFTDWNVATLTGLVPNPEITFEVQFITLPMLPV